MKALVAKQFGNSNSVFDVKAMNFFATLDTLSRRSFEIDSTNLFSPSLRTIQQTNAQKGDVPFIECYHTRMKAFVKVNIKEYIEKICTHLDLDVIPFSISIDATKFLKNIFLSSAHKCIVGYASPSHAISIENKSI